MGLSFDKYIYCFGTKILKYLIPLLSIIGTLIYSCIKPIFGINLQNFSRSIIPERYWTKFTQEVLLVGWIPTSHQIKHLGKWLDYILSNPIFGSGRFFPSKFLAETGIYRGHSIIFLELAISYGLPVALIIFAFIVYLLSKGSLI